MKFAISRVRVKDINKADKRLQHPSGNFHVKLPTDTNRKRR